MRYHVRVVISVILAAIYLWFAVHAPFPTGLCITVPAVAAILIVVALDKSNA